MGVNSLLEKIRLRVGGDIYWAEIYNFLIAGIGPWQ